MRQVVILYLLVFSLLTGVSSAKEYDPKKRDTISVFFNAFKPSRVYGVSSGDPNAQRRSNEVLYGFGLSYNGLQFSYSEFYKEGKRYSINYYFLRELAVSPYIGGALIQGTNIKDTATARSLDSFDGVAGVEISYFKYVRPYFEYNLASSLVIFGVKFHLPFTIEKRKA